MRASLTPRQAAVLQWISDGCAIGAWPDNRHKNSARALEARGLVKVGRRKGAWHAALLPDGRYYIEHREYPPEKTSGRYEAAIPRPSGTPAARASHGAATKTGPAKARPSATNPAAVSPTDELVARIQAAGGTLTINEDSTDRDLRRLDAQIRAIVRYRKLPPPQRLLVERPNWGTRILTIDALPDWITAVPVHVPIPEQLRNPSPAVAALKEADHLAISGQPRSRALRLLQGLAAAATGRDYTVTAVAGAKDQYGRPVRDPVHLRFGVRGHDIGLSITQENDRSEHIPTAAELARKERDSWYTIPRYDYSPAQRLRISLHEWFEQQQTNWADGARTSLDGKLGEILQQIEICSDLCERNRQAQQERERQRQLEEQRRVDRATAQLIQSHRASVLDAQLTAWYKARQLDEYLTAMASRISQMDDPQAAAAASEWLTWARNHTAHLDPLCQPITMPPDPEPNAAALAPFLEHRSYW
jgi:hypothetical protein